MAQAERFGYVVVVGHGQDATGSFQAFVTDYHGAVVQRTVLEKDIFDKALVDVSVDDIARLDDFVQPHVALDDNQRACLLLAHAETGHYDGHDFLAVYVRFLPPAEPPHQSAHVAPRTYAGKEMAYFLLKEDYQGQGAHIDQLVEDAAQQTHLEDLGNQYPDQHEYQYAGKDVGRAGLFHQSVDVVEQQRHQYDVDQVDYAESNHRKSRVNVGNWPAARRKCARPRQRPAHRAHAGCVRPASGRRY